MSDAGLAHLHGMAKLQTLDLRKTEVTDAGLTHLKSLTQLLSLELAGARVTDAGVAQLKTRCRTAMFFVEMSRG